MSEVSGLLDLYRRTEIPPPVLDLADLAILKSFFDEQRMDMKGGARSRGTIAELLALSLQERFVRSYLESPHSLVGPHILGGQYDSNGIGIWAPFES